jgi:flagellar protein FlbD
MLLNPDHIVSMEETPDTVITLFNGNHLLVREHAQVILNRIIAFRIKILRRSSTVPKGHGYLRRQRNTQYHRHESEHFLSNTNSGEQLRPLHRQDT